MSAADLLRYERRDLRDHLQGVCWEAGCLRAEEFPELSDRQLLELFRFLTTGGEAEICAALNVECAREIAGIPAAIREVKDELERRGLKAKRAPGRRTAERA